MAFPGDICDFHPVGDAHYMMSIDLADIISAGRSLLQHKVNRRISRLIGFMDPQRSAASLLQQARHIRGSYFMGREAVVHHHIGNHDPFAREGTE